MEVRWAVVVVVSGDVQPVVQEPVVVHLEYLVAVQVIPVLDVLVLTVLEMYLNQEVVGLEELGFEKENVV